MSSYCQKIQEKIIESDMLTAWLPEETSHLQTCETCRELQEAHLRALSLGDALQRLRRDELALPSPWLAQRIRVRAEQRKEKASSLWKREHWVGAFVVASLVFLVLLSPLSIDKGQHLPKAKTQKSLVHVAKTKPKEQKSSPVIQKELEWLMQQAWETMRQATGSFSDDEELFASVLQSEPFVEIVPRRDSFFFEKEQKAFSSWEFLGRLGEQVPDDPAPIAQTLPAPLRDVQELIEEMVPSDDPTML